MSTVGKVAMALLSLLLLLPTVAAADSPTLPGARNCPVFPKNNPWNTDISNLPVDSRSNAYIESIDSDTGLHPDFGSGLWEGRQIGIPFNVVGKAKRYRVPFDYADESDPGPYPIPRKPKIEGGSDRHILVVDRRRCRLYELYATERAGSGWRAGSGAIWHMRSNKLRPSGWTSADAAGLPILPGLVRYDEVKRGRINHALRFTVERSQRAFVYPARHFASDLTDQDLPPMGLRLRLKKSFDTTGFPSQPRIVLEALKRYGMIVADNGANWYISGAPNRRWDNDALHLLDDVKGSDFEVVDTSSLPKPGL